MSAPDDRRVLVTGATGFVGAPLLPALRARGLTPVALGRRRAAGAEWIEVDLADPVATAAAVRAAGAGRLVHLAWTATPGRFWTDPDNLDWIGRSLWLLRAFAESGGTRAVLAGSCAEYPWGTADRLDEATTPPGPATLYGAAKDAARRAAEAYAAQVGLSLAWARLFFLYGPGEPAGKLVGDAIRALRAGRPFDTSEGLQRRDFLHVDDVAGALAALAARDVRGAVNVGSGHAVPVREIIAEIVRQTRGAALVRYGARPTAPGEPPCIEAATRRLREEAGFVPRHDLASGIAATLAGVAPDHPGGATA